MENVLVASPKLGLALSRAPHRVRLCGFDRDARVRDRGQVALAREAELQNAVVDRRRRRPASHGRPARGGDGAGRLDREGQRTGGGQLRLGVDVKVIKA